MYPWLIFLGMLSQSDPCRPAGPNYSNCRAGEIISYRETVSDGIVFMEDYCCPGTNLIEYVDFNYDGTSRHWNLPIAIDPDANGKDWQIRFMDDWICLKREER